MIQLSNTNLATPAGQQLVPLQGVVQEQPRRVEAPVPGRGQLPVVELSTNIRDVLLSPEKVSTRSTVKLREGLLTALACWPPRAASTASTYRGTGHGAAPRDGGGDSGGGGAGAGNGGGPRNPSRTACPLG